MGKAQETNHHLMVDVVNDDDCEDDLYIGDDGADILDADGDEDIDIVDDGSNLDADTKRFDQIVGVLEDILMDPDFEQQRVSFCRENCVHFEESHENKLIYTQLFHQYTELVEAGIESRLKKAVDGFDMQAFLILLDSKKEELMSDVFDLLVSLGDFESFREVMLEYKRETTQGGLGLEVTCHAMKICTEEQEDGEERPDLDLGLTISPVGPGPRAMKA